MRSIFLSFLLILTSCKNEIPPKTLRISFNTMPNTLDPQKAGDFISSTLACMTYEGLTRCSQHGGDVEPALAEKVTISEDKTLYTFTLKQANWSDGSPITAFDFERSWKKALTLPSLCLHLFYPIKGVEKWLQDKADLAEVGIWALDENTFVVQLEKPTPYFYALTAFPSFLPSKEDGIYSGPFMLAKKPTQSEIVLVKNKTYWNQKNITIDTVEIAIIADEMTALQLFEQGKLDWIGGSLSPLPLDSLEKLEGQIISIPSAGTTLCTFNTQKAPFDNPNLRKAFAYAIDRKHIVEQITMGSQIPAQSMLPPSLSSQQINLFDELKAKQYLEQALTKIEALPSLTLYYRPGQMEKRLAQTLQSQWQEVLGVTVELVQLDFKSHTHRLHTKDYHIAIASWIAQFNDPMSILERYKNPNGSKNYPGWSDEMYQNLMEKENTIGAEALLKEHMPLTPIYHWSSPSLKGPRIRKTASSPCGGILFEQFALNES